MPKALFTSFPVLTTERLILRQLADTDDNELFALRSDRNVNKYLGRQPGQSLEDAKAFIQTIAENVKKNNSIYWAISLSGKLIGTICLFEFTDDHLSAEIGYELLPKYQGKGFMQEAASTVVNFGFQDIGLRFIVASTHSENQNSIKLLEKFGFERQSPADINADNSVITFKLLRRSAVK